MNAAHRGWMLLVAVTLIAWPSIGFSGCGDDDGRADGAVDAGRADGGAAPDAGEVPTATEPALPVFTPCPTGWREIPADASTGSPAVCEPWPESGFSDCADDAMHLPGAAGCAQVGTACPADGYPADLPVDAPVLFVREGATGGDGSRSMPLSTIQAAEDIAPDGATIAVAVGHYPDSFILDHPVTVRGACAETQLGTVFAPGIAFFVRAEGVAVENLAFVNTDQGLWLTSGSVTVSGVIFRDIRNTSLNIGTGDAVVMDSSFIRYGRAAVDIQLGAITMSRVSMRGGTQSAFNVVNGTLTMSDSVVSEVGDVMLPALTSISGSTPSSSVRIERTVFDQNLTSGFYVSDLSTADLVDVVFRLPDTRPTVRDVGMVALDSAALTLTRVRVEGALFQGIGAGDGATIVATDVILRDIVADPESGRSTGVEIAARSTGELTRVLIERTSGFGVFVDASQATLTDVTMRDIEPSTLDGALGRGLQVQRDSDVSGVRVAIERAHEAAIVSAGADTAVRLSDLLVLDTRASACRATGCEPAGVGAASLLGGAVHLDRFVIARSALVGAMIAPEGSLDLSNGLVEGNPIGVNVQVDGYDVARLNQHVVYRDNGTNLDSSALPVPSASVVDVGM